MSQAIKISHPESAPQAYHPVSHSTALYETGRKILTDSFDTGKEFCKFMLTLSIGAIPVYLGLIILALPYDSDKGTLKGMALLIPGCIFLISAIIFSIAYFPTSVYFSTDAVGEVERARLKIIRHRSKMIKVGFLIFAIGTLLGMVAVIKAHL